MGQDERFGENIITGDKTLCFAYDLATKQQSAEWVGQNSNTKETAISKIASEDDVNCFFDAEGVIHREFVREGQKVYAEFYVGVLDQLLKRI